MTAVRAVSSTSGSQLVGSDWLIDVCADVVPVVTVTSPDGTITSPDPQSFIGSWINNGYEITVPLDVPGRWVATVIADGQGAGFTVRATEITPAAAMPDITDVDTYLGTHSWSDDQLQDALDAETSAQEDVCRVPAAYPNSLRQALLRRVQRNLAMRGQPAVQVTDGGPVYTPTNDPEVRRFERPWRKLTIG